MLHPFLPGARLKDQAFVAGLSSVKNKRGSRPIVRSAPIGPQMRVAGGARCFAAQVIVAAAALPSVSPSDGTARIAQYVVCMSHKHFKRAQRG